MSEFYSIFFRLQFAYVYHPFVGTIDNLNMISFDHRQKQNEKSDGSMDSVSSNCQPMLKKTVPPERHSFIRIFRRTANLLFLI